MNINDLLDDPFEPKPVFKKEDKPSIDEYFLFTSENLDINEWIREWVRANPCRLRIFNTPYNEVLDTQLKGVCNGRDKEDDYEGEDVERKDES